ncbi:unnamed protein product [Prunus armeniaca]
MTNSSSSRVLDFKGVEVMLLEDKVHKSEVKTRDDGENVVGSMGTKKMLLTKMVIDGTPRWVKLDIKVKEDGYQQ